jgi:hypothetical protein
MLRVTSLVASLVVLACNAEAGRAAGAGAAPPATDKSVSQTTEKSLQSVAAPAKEAPKISLAAEPGAAARVRGNVPGPIDPPWFRADLFAGATMTSSGRTPPDDQGLFSTQMLFALPAGTTREACLETLAGTLSAVVPAPVREEGKDGRVTLRGSNADYEVTTICGEARGTMSAYVAYRWIKAPAPVSTPATPSP